MSGTMSPPPPKKRRRASSSASNVSMQSPEYEGQRSPHVLYIPPFHAPPPYGAPPGHIQYLHPSYTVGPGQAPMPMGHLGPPPAVAASVGSGARGGDAHGAGVASVAVSSHRPPPPTSRLDSHFQLSARLPAPPPPEREQRWITSPSVSTHTTPYRYPPLVQEEPPAPAPVPTTSPSIGIARSSSFSGGNNQSLSPSITRVSPSAPTTEPARRISISRTSPPHITMNTNGRYATSSPVASTSHHTAPPQAAAPLPPLSLSILGVEPLDEFIKDIADFVHHMITTRPEGLNGLIEVEAKIGLLKEKGAGGQRLRLPVRCESILEPNGIDVRFESNMSQAQHKHFNQLLNNLKTDPPANATTPIEYSHLFLIDNFYADPNAGHDPILQEFLSGLQGGVPGAGRGAEKIRVTRDDKTGNVVQCVRKIRLGDLNIFSPQRGADWRVSVNLEVPVPHPVGSPLFTRRKDRLRYEHEEFVIDLTQVTSSGSNNGPEKLHELELEIARPELLLATAAKRNDVTLGEHERSAFDELIRAFVNNARILTRNAMGEGWQ